MSRLARRLGSAAFWLMSAYLALTLVIALSEQGQPTDDLAVSTQAPALYPIWYQNPALQTAASLGFVVYPAAAFALLLARLTRRRPRTAESAPETGLAETGFAEAPPPLAGDESPARVRTASLPASQAPSLRDPATLCSLDSGFVIRGIGAAAADLFALTPAALIGRPLPPLLMPQDLPRLQQAVLASQADPLHPVSIAVGLRQPDGTALPTQAECHLRLEAEGMQIVLRLQPLLERGPLGDQLAALWY